MLSFGATLSRYTPKYSRTDAWTLAYSTGVLAHESAEVRAVNFSHDELTPCDVLTQYVTSILRNVHDRLLEETQNKWHSRILNKGAIAGALVEYDTELDDAVRSFQVSEPAICCREFFDRLIVPCATDSIIGEHPLRRKPAMRHFINTA